MNLAIDIGNTHTKIGLFEGPELRSISISGEPGDGLFSSTFNKTSSFILPTESIEQLLSHHKVERAIIAKAGSDNAIERILAEKNIPALVLSHQLKLPLEVLYKTPQTLGADRLAGSVAAKSLFPENNVLKIDFGTCITYDFVNSGNQYLGGAISPGMTMRFKSLHHYTAKLPLIEPGKLTSFDLIGADTTTSILNGVVNGIKEEVNGIIKEYSMRFGNLRVVATGGDVGFFVTLLKNEIFARPYLVLEGLNLILNYNI